ncbi:O-antigen ligase family protein [Salimicrobium halophilum]|uniref:O-antigen ligase n=1 Tax=Salimicrobium halophilum TaxID=86666 RepID=A0A1G8S4K3_9BACI|nr:O-antigen ligase family protein [Salimicrobium halophilum]SDJ24148.1 O-antigen ligase [Salimicrobium halophilum]
MKWMDYKWVLVFVALFLIGVIIPVPMVGYAVTLAAVVLSFLKPRESLLALIPYFATRSFLKELTPALRLTGDLMILAALARVLWDTRKEWKRWFSFHPFEYGFFAFLIIGFGAGFLTGVSPVALVFQVRAFMITYFVFYIVRLIGVKEGDKTRLMWVTFFSALLLSIQGIIEKMSTRTLLMPEAWVERFLSPTNSSRIYGLMDNPNVLATFLTFGLLVTVGLLFKQHKTALKVLIGIALVLMAGAWIMTYSRGTFIGIGVGVVVYFVLTRHWKGIAYLAGAMIIAYVLVVLPTNTVADWVATTDRGQVDRKAEDDSDSDRLKETFDRSTLELSMTSGRLFIVMKGFEIFRDYPVAGSGFGTFGDSATKSYVSPLYEDYGIPRDTYSDNQYIQIIAQTGVLGVIAFAVFLLGMLTVLWKARKDVKEAPLVLALLLGVYVSSLVYNLWEDKAFSTMYFLLFGYVFTRFKSKWPLLNRGGE